MALSAVAEAAAAAAGGSNDADGLDAVANDAWRSRRQRPCCEVDTRTCGYWLCSSRLTDVRRPPPSAAHYNISHSHSLVPSYQDIVGTGSLKCQCSTKMVTLEK